MTKLTILWLGIVSLLVTLGMLLFNASIYNTCYDIHVVHIAALISYLNPKASCLVTISSIIFSIMFLGSILVTLFFYGIYVLIFNQPMPFARTSLWLAWLVFAYYCVFLLNLFYYR